MFYATGFDESKHQDSISTWAVVRPEDQKWAFVENLSEVVDMETRKLKKDCDIVWHSLVSALSVISNEIKPDFAVPHLFCYLGCTKYR